MSLSKQRRSGLRSDAKERQRIRESFSHRVCDDFCEEILKFMSFEDKIRFECVSKQFQRSVFQRQYKLSIAINENNGNYLSQMYRKGRIYLKAFESVVKKCQNLKSIDLMSYMTDNNEDNNKMIELIVKYCHNLNEIYLGFDSQIISFKRGLDLIEKVWIKTHFNWISFLGFKQTNGLLNH